MLQCFALFCSVQHVAVCCSVLQCVAVCCSVLHCVAVCCIVLQCVAVCWSALQCLSLTRTRTVRSFAAIQAAGGASELLHLVFVLSAADLEQDYLELLGVLQNDSRSSGAGLAQYIAPHSVRQRVHEFLCLSTWQGVWLGVLDDL